MVALAGCDAQAEVEIVQGPLAGSPKIQASFTWDGTGTGTIAAVLPNGEVCTGRYFTNMKWPSEPLFSLDWYAQYFGSSFDPWGMQYGQAILTGDYGRVIKLEYFTDLSNHGYVLGLDNGGNVYKLTF
ncbi:MAG: hypothetical protein AB1700_10905 [Bacillota bacterium]